MEEECLELWHLSSQVTFTHDEALLYWKWLNTYLLMGISEFVLLACASFLLPINFFALTHKISHYYLSISHYYLSLIPLCNK